MSTKVVATAIFILLSVFTVNLSHAVFPIKQEGHAISGTATTLPGNEAAERIISNDLKPENGEYINGWK